MGLTPWKMRKLRSHVFSSKPYAGFRMLPFCRKRQLSGVHMENYTRERWSLPFDPPARRAVLRRRRQRDSSLWTPFHRLRAGRICPFICAASARQRDGGPKGRLRQVFPHVSIKKHHGFLWDTARRSRTVHRIAHDDFCICFVIGTARLPFGCCTHS